MPKPFGGNKMLTGENAHSTAQRILARRGTEAMLPFFRDLHQGKLFEADGAQYRYARIFLDDLGRIIGEGQRTSK